jgi:hypothetical protein
MHTASAWRFSLQLGTGMFLVDLLVDLVDLR